jgi:hypothetical protein
VRTERGGREERGGSETFGSSIDVPLRCFGTFPGVPEPSARGEEPHVFTPELLCDTRDCCLRRWGVAPSHASLLPKTHAGNDESKFYIIRFLYYHWLKNIRVAGGSRGAIYATTPRGIATSSNMCTRAVHRRHVSNPPRNRFRV